MRGVLSLHSCHVLILTGALSCPIVMTELFQLHRQSAYLAGRDSAVSASYSLVWIFQSRVGADRPFRRLFTCRLSTSRLLTLRAPSNMPCSSSG